MAVLAKRRKRYFRDFNRKTWREISLSYRVAMVRVWATYQEIAGSIPGTSTVLKVD